MQEKTTTSPGLAPSEHDFVALPVGARIARYRILEILGQGGFGITYRAVDEQLHREVAIKEYLPMALAVRQDGTTVLPRSTKVADDFGWGRERFVAEGRTLASLHDAPGIVRVFDFMELNGTAYIVMELVRGDTLEARLKQGGTFGPAEIDRILGTLLDGLEQVHGAGFLHRDIKPANILMRPDGRPTLIDFGASRAAMAGRTVAMTAIFTPGYAAPEQFTAAKQGPWTDIYGLSATLYHAITGTAPPSAFDRMLEDGYQPLARVAPPGFARGLLIGIDAGLTVRATDRPQSITGWRPLLARTGFAANDATMVIGRAAPDGATMVMGSATAPASPSTPPPTAAVPPQPAPPARKRTGLYAAAAAAALLLLGAGFAMIDDKPSRQAVSVQDMKVEELEKALEARRKADAEAAEKRRIEEEAQRKAQADSDAKRAADEELTRAEAQRQQAEQELARLKEELEAQRRAAAEQRELADAQARRATAEEARRKVEAEMAALRQAEEDAKRKAAVEAEAKRLADEALAKAQAERLAADAEAKARADAEAKQKAEADAKTRAEAEARAEADVERKKNAEAAETALRLTTIDRQRLQVALTALGFDTRGSDGVFGPRSREMIASWQARRNEPATGFLTAAQQQALLRDAAPAVGKFDDGQRNDGQKNVDEKATAATAAASAAAAASAKANAATVQTPPQQTAAAAPPPVAGANPYDGRWSGMANLSNGHAQPLSVTLQNGTGQSNWRSARCGGDVVYRVTIQSNGAFAVQFSGYDFQCQQGTSTFRGTVQNNTLTFRFQRGAATFTLSR